MLHYINPKTREVLLSSEEFEKVKTIEELKTLFKPSNIVGENKSMTVFSLYVKGEEIIKDDDDDNDSFVDEIDNYCIVVVNNNDIQDSSMFVTYGPKPIVNVKIYDNIVIVNSIPHIVENNVMLTYHKTIDDFEDVNAEDYNSINKQLNEITTYQELVKACEDINSFLAELDFIEEGNYVFLKSEIDVYGNHITLDQIKSITKYNTNYQEMKEWDFDSDYTLELDEILLQTIRSLVNKSSDDVDVQLIINLLEKAYRDNVELDWEKLDNNEITANEMVTNYLVKEYQKVMKEIKEKKKKKRGE
jgi:hypothetical protein